MPDSELTVINLILFFDLNLTLEIFTLLFSVASAWHDVVPVRMMVYYGAKRSDEKVFHSSGFIQRGLFTSAVSISELGISLDCVVLFFLLALIQFVTFDFILHWKVKGNPFYVGYTAYTDKLLRRWFGNAGGVMKFVCCIYWIVAINLLWK